jgi:hypothetical protein
MLYANSLSYNLCSKSYRIFCPTHFNYSNAPLILKMRDIIFFAGKLHNGPFQGIFRGGQDFFDPEIAPRCAQDNLGSLRSPGIDSEEFYFYF